MTFLLTIKERIRGLLFILFFGIIIFVWQLGSTGLVDETPPLFAAASRAMVETGDWLTPQVNGLPRFDKPPLVYWLMAIGYSIPGNSFWDPLGTWAARLPSALSTILLMLFLGDTLMKYPQENNPFNRRTAVISALTFGLSPLVMIWGRIAVSDALLCSNLGICLLLQWRRYANPKGEKWWISWLFLSFAILTKGPVSLILIILINFLFGLHQNDLKMIWKRLRPLSGLFLAFSISIPWYLIELLKEGKPFYDSFFGYHNFQRFTSVVNSHSEPWWFFLFILCIASLPFTPLLFLSIWGNLSNILSWSKRVVKKPEKSLNEFAFFWLASVFIFFTSSATKLPSYWLPATPAAAILISFSLTSLYKYKQLKNLAWIMTIFFGICICALMFLAPFWVEFLNDPEMPSFPQELISSLITYKGGFIFLLFVLLGITFSFRNIYGSLIILQLPLVFFNSFVILPGVDLADRLRQLPLRNASKMLLNSQRENEPLVMVGAMKPSLHFYTNKIIVFEGRSKNAFVNVSDRLKNEKRRGWYGKPLYGESGSKTTLLVIDKESIMKSYWKGLNQEVLGEFGVYSVWRLNREDLDNRAEKLKEAGVVTTWQEPRPERF